MPIEDAYVFANNFINALNYLRVNEIPISGEKYNEGMKCVENKLKEKYSLQYSVLKQYFSKEYDKHSDIERAIISLRDVSVKTGVGSAYCKVLINNNSFMRKPNEPYLELAKDFCKKAFPHLRVR